MKNVAILSVVVALAGCAGMPSGSEPPHIDERRGAAVSPGYPLDFVRSPPGYGLKDNRNQSGRKASDRAGDVASVNMHEHLFTWESLAGDPSMATLWQISVDPRSELFPITDSQGYEFVGGDKVQYWGGWGRYEELVPAGASEMENKPECVATVQLAITTPSMRHRSIASLIESVPCAQGGALTSSDYAEMRQRAYQAFGLR